MRFYVDYDQGHAIRCWVVPDNPVAISRVFVALDGRRVAEIPASITDPTIRINGWHSTGQCVFQITDAEAPGLTQARRVEIYDADTNVLIYRRSPNENLIRGKVLLVDTSINADSVIQSVMFERFQQNYFGIGKLSDEILRVLFESPWLTSSFLSGPIIIPRYEGFFISDNFLTTALIHDPFVEMATRLLWLKARAAVAADPVQNWRLGRLAEAAAFVSDYDFDDPKALKRFFRMLPEPAYHLLYNPLTRQFGTRLPDDRLQPGNSIVAIEILARVGIVGHRDFFEAFVTTLFDRLGIDGPVPVPEPIPADVMLLAERLRPLKVAQEMLVFDIAMADAVRDAVGKGWNP
ncbi:hypothetical protein G3T14_02675 [Methylobacterium sp. BTF04]|uniref:hypothetical protein n=1 Tax=Methylobacterium sp. BTF04 TaxID=2708300 RepID=UPI0013CF4FAF|nr:hypothetical protein [Methylobacterium sp. BTF04]NEU11037.1 hypothetical protein [Methylobacterium sp. BTF04]